MLIKIDKYLLKTYSLDLICIKHKDETVSSSFDIRTCLNYLVKNGIVEFKNRVDEVLIDFTTYDTTLIKDSFYTKNYTIKKCSKTEYEVKDRINRNNSRYVNKHNLLKKLYLLEINKIEASSIDELVAGIKQLNIDLKKYEGL